MNRNMTKKLLLVLLVLALVLSSACSTGSVGSADNSGSTESTESTESAESSESAVTDAGDADSAVTQAGDSESNKSGKRIYFAAPLFNEAERSYNLEVVTLLESYGYEVFLPQRDGFLAPELEGKTEEEKTEIIFEKDKEEVLKSDILFMIIDGRVPDEGACVELGIAYASGIRCYGFKNDARSVEIDMDINPMLTGCFIKLFSNTNNDELIKSLKEYLDENEL